MLLRPRNLVILTAVAFLLADAAMVEIALHGDFGFDFSCCYQQAGQHLLNDQLDPLRLEPTVHLPLLPMGSPALHAARAADRGQAVWAWFALKVAVLAGLAAWYSAPWAVRQRILVAAPGAALPAALARPGAGKRQHLHRCGAAGPAAPSRTGGRRRLRPAGAPGAQAAPHPGGHLARRSSSARGCCGTGRPARRASLLGVLVFGVDAWVAYARTFTEPLTRTFTANIGFSGLLGPAGVAVGACAALLVVRSPLRSPRDGMGLGLSITAGVILGPYTFIHYLSGLLVAAEPILRTAPRRLAAFPWLALVFPLMPVWLAGIAGVEVASHPPGLQTVPPVSGRSGGAARR